MMEAILPRSWKEEFERAATARRDDVAEKERRIRLALNERKRLDREREDEKQEREQLAMLEAALAPPQYIADFKVRLDRYDTVTVEALMDNQEALSAARKRIETMLDNAEVLPDGRRVFKSKDGQRVFDEHGQELAKETIDPASIDDKKIRWETFQAETEAERRLQEDRQRLIDYQAQLDKARERLDKGEITNKELQDLKSGLAADMPDTVRAKLDRNDPAARPSAEPDEAGSMPDNMDALMQHTGLGPRTPSGLR